MSEKVSVRSVHEEVHVNIMKDDSGWTQSRKDGNSKRVGESVSEGGREGKVT